MTLTRTLLCFLKITLVLLVTSYPNVEGSPRATRDDLIRYLNSISGSNTISGQHNREPNSDPSKWTRTAKDITGKFPGLWGGDFLFLPDDVGNRQTMINEAIKQWNSGSVVALTWHVCPPTVGVTCNWDKDGILGQLNDNQWNDLINSGGNLNNLWKKRIDTVVPYFKQLESAGVIAIWRPIHEMNEAWSWWGGRPGSNGSRKLYQITYDYMVQNHGLKSLVWTWNVKDINMQSIGDYWPGGEYVDVASLDMWVSSYPSDLDYQRMVNLAGSKPIALAEVGAVPTPELLNRQPKWAWFMVWAEYLKDPKFNTDDTVKNIYYSPRVFSQGNINIGGPEKENLALNRPTFSSSQESSLLGSANAVDGNFNTRWSSSLAEEQWIYVDLGLPRNIGQVKLFWEAAYAKGYQIQTSLNNESWLTVYENYNGNGGTVTVNLQVSARYVKVYAFQRGTAYGYSLYEIQVFS